MKRNALKHKTHLLDFESYYSIEYFLNNNKDALSRLYYFQQEFFCDLLNSVKAAQSITKLS
jgi:hypothetical protein